MKVKYTDEINIQILIALLKAHNIKKIVASPGSTNISFVATVQNDDYFEVYSSVDERSACYIACGLAAESREPVVITCTGATASRNYASGLTEAFYRKLPIVALTFTQHAGRIGQNIAQVIDRTQIFNDIAKISVQIPTVYSDEDKWACNLAINKALLELNHKGGGPVHINMATVYSQNFSVEVLPEQRVITRVTYSETFPLMEFSKIAILVGNHLPWTEEEVKVVENFCEKYDSVVLCDHTSNYNGKYKVLPNIITDQKEYASDLKNIDLIIDIGNVSGAYIFLNPKEVWRVNPDGEIRDSMRKLRYIFEMKEFDFFNRYCEMKESMSETSYYDSWAKEEMYLRSCVDNECLPFSNIWIAKNLSEKLPNDSIVHLGILNTLRSWNFFKNDKNIRFYCNTGGFGIDGIVSTLIGASLCNPSKIVFGFVGDLAFFYDMNSIGNRHVGKNIRLMIINNGCGTEFHNYNHRAAAFGSMANDYIAADGHYGHKSKSLVKNYATSLGFKYISANNKEDFEHNIDEFVTENSDTSIIFEVFTDSDKESEALKYIHRLKKDKTIQFKNSIKKVISPTAKHKIKKIIGK